MLFVSQTALIQVVIEPSGKRSAEDPAPSTTDGWNHPGSAAHAPLALVQRAGKKRERPSRAAPGTPAEDLIDPERSPVALDWTQYRIDRSLESGL
jgi:hypothetical protein